MLLIQFLLCSFVGVAAAADSSERELYVDYTNLARVDVSTSYSGIQYAYGIAAGEFEGNEGLFISAFKPPAVYFMDTSNGCESDNTCALTKLVGTGVAGITDGSFFGSSGTQASVSDPSRMAYSAALNVVFVMDRTNGLIRFMNLATRTMGTLTSGGSPIQIYGSKLPDNNPELDIKINGEYLYLSDSSWIYNVTGTDGTLLGALTDASITPYHALKAWQIANGYERSQKVYLTSLAINALTREIYVSYTYRRHAIVVIKMDATSINDVDVLVSDNILWNPVQTVPKPMNGFIDTPPTTGYSYVTFPMHLHYDPDTNGIYFLEVFAHFSSGTILGALGSVAVRRLLLDTRMIDYIAGNEGVFRAIYGKQTGFVDGWADVAEFSYPVSLAFIGSSVSGNGGLKAYVVDSQNSAIRKVESITDTPYPTASPTISQAPTTPTVAPTTGFPSVNPTSSPLTPMPSVAPTLQPSISLTPTVYSPPTGVPTELNGECLSFTVSDTFGDGWGGARLRVDTPGHDEEVIWFEPTTSEPETFTVCSSYLRPEQFGMYSAMIVAPDGTEAMWEIRWSATIEASRQTYDGVSDSLLVFSFDDNGYVFMDSSNMRTVESLSCRRCQHPKPKPKPTATYDDDDRYLMAEMVVTQDEYRQLLPGSKPPPPTPKPPVKTNELPFVLHDNGGNGWLDSRGDGSSYSVMNADRTDLISEGTICGEDLLKDDCAVDLPDGDYYFRVTGSSASQDEEVYWTFCRQHGFARQELSFSMISGECYPGVMRDAAVILSSPLSTKISLSGHLLVENVFGPALSYDDKTSIEKAMSAYLSEENVTTVDVVVTSVCQSETGKFCSEEKSSGDNNATDTDDSRRRGGRKLKNAPSKPKPIPTGTSTWDVSLLVTAMTEDMGVDGTRYTRLVSLSKKIGRSITDGVLSGGVQAALHTTAKDSPTLAWTHVKREEPTKLVHINYVSTAPPSVTPVAAVSGDEGQRGDVSLEAEVVTVVVDNSNAQYLMLFAIVGVPMLVFAAFLVYRRADRSSDTDVLLSTKSSVVQKGGWENVVFNDASAGAADNTQLMQDSSNRGGALRAHDSETVVGRSPALPYPSSSSKHSSTVASIRKESSSNSALSVDAMLQIPGRASATNSDSSSRRAATAAAGETNISPVARQVPLATVGSARLPQAIGAQRDRFRVREGLDHHDVSLSSSARSGLTEDKIVL